MTAVAEARKRPKISFWNDPKVRSTFVQTVLVIVLAFFACEIAHNTIISLKSRNSAAGFDFLSRSAGFDIIQTLVTYASGSSYGTALLVGFLNTVLIAILGIIAATLIGFTMGVMRLSKNWLMAKVATLYIEIFRNVPLLLWIFVWYSAVLQPLPGPRQSFNLANLFFLSNRGLMMPKPIFGDGAWLGLAGLAVAVVAWALISRWAKVRQEATGQPFPAFWTGIALVVLLPLLGLAIAGFPITWEI